MANEQPSFFKVKGAGAGDLDTGQFMAVLRNRAQEEFGLDLSEKRICGENGLCVDFYFPEESTIVEVALGLRNPLSEFERDILKAIMAKETGHAVQQVLFLSKPGARKRCSQPGARAILEWAKRAHGIAIEVRELENIHAV